MVINVAECKNAITHILIAFVDKELWFCTAVGVGCSALLINATECADTVHFPLDYNSALFSFVVVCFG